MDIFLLEDDDAIAMGLTYSFEPEGYQVTRASTVKEAMLFDGRTHLFLIYPRSYSARWKWLRCLPENQRKGRFSR